jgi:hypothetical protein
MAQQSHIPHEDRQLAEQIEGRLNSARTESIRQDLKGIEAALGCI